MCQREQDLFWRNYDLFRYDHDFACPAIDGETREENACIFVEANPTEYARQGRSPLQRLSIAF